MRDERKIDLQNDFTEEEESVFTTERFIARKVSEDELAEFKKAWEKMEPAPVVTPEESKRLSMEDVIAKQYKLGMTLKQIQTEHNISAGKVYEILARKGVPLRNGRQRSKSNERLSMMTELEKQSLIRDYKDGMPLASIFNKYDINKHGCYIILDEANIPRRLERDVGNDIANEMLDNIEEELIKGDTGITQPEPLNSQKIDGGIIAKMGRSLEYDTGYKAKLDVHGNTLHIKINKKHTEPIKNIQLSFDFEEDK